MVALLVDASFPFWLVGLLMLPVDNILRTSAGKILLSWSNVVFARRMVLLPLGVSASYPVGYVSSSLLINSNADMS